jgi:hypothetical protein
MQYVVMKNEETNQIELIGRFKSPGIEEISDTDKWSQTSQLHNDLLDGMLDYITEPEALSLIAERAVPQLQAA